MTGKRHKAMRIAVLGAGIMGSSLAIMLARRGCGVTLFDQATEPFARASRWNEGKIHLGYLYAGDPTLATADKVITGGLRFRHIVESLIGCPLHDVSTPMDDLYLVHRNSVVAADDMERYFADVSQKIREHPDAADYLTDITGARARRLPDAELATLSPSTDIVAGFSVPERSVMTSWIADRFVDAVRGESRIKFRAGTYVRAVREEERGLVVDTAAGEDRFDLVVNALWEGRRAVDRQLFPDAGEPSSARYRVSAFVTTRAEIDLPSCIIATGPYGDIKNYDGRNFYVSWYPAGLLADITDESVPVDPGVAPESRAALAQSIFASLTPLLPEIGRVYENAADLKIEGGWVIADGRGRLDDPRSTLHRRDRFGIRRIRNYISVDTGKYSMAPWLAERIVEEIVA